MVVMFTLGSNIYGFLFKCHKGFDFPVFVGNCNCGGAFITLFVSFMKQGAGGKNGSAKKEKTFNDIISTLESPPVTGQAIRKAANYIVKSKDKLSRDQHWKALRLLLIRFQSLEARLTGDLTFRFLDNRMNVKEEFEGVDSVELPYVVQTEINRLLVKLYQIEHQQEHK